MNLVRALEYIRVRFVAYPISTPRYVYRSQKVNSDHCEFLINDMWEGEGALVGRICVFCTLA